MSDDLVIGVDVSAHQDPSQIDWKRFREQGVRYAVFKAAEGIGDALYDADKHAAKAAEEDLLIGYYAFMRPRLPKYAEECAEGTDVRASARAQADQFVKNIGALPFPTFGLWADIETKDENLTSQHVTDFLEEFCSRCAASGFLVGIYSGFYFLKDQLDADALRAAGLSKYPLWIPWYHGKPTGPKRIPPPWDDWVVHQWTDTGKLDGFSGNLDLNVAKREFVTKILRDLPGVRLMPEWAQDFLLGF